MFSLLPDVRLVCLITFLISLNPSTIGTVVRPRSKCLLLDLKWSSQVTDPHSFTPVPGQTKEENNDPLHKYLHFQALIWWTPGVEFTFVQVRIMERQAQRDSWQREGWIQDVLLVWAQPPLQAPPYLILNLQRCGFCPWSKVTWQSWLNKGRVSDSKPGK